MISDGENWVSLGIQDIPDGAVSTDKFADSAITYTKIADGSISSTHIVDGTLSPSKLAGNPGNGVTGTTLISNGDGTFSWDGFVSSQGNQIVENKTVGIGITSPSEELEISGTVKIVDGNQGADKILTSDSNGLASWQELPDVTSITADVNKNITFTTSGTGKVLVVGNQLTLSNTTIISSATSAKTITLPDSSGVMLLTSDGSISNITSSQIQDQAIISSKILDNTIQSTDIADEAIVPSKLAGNPGDGVTGTTLLSNGDGTFSWGGFMTSQGTHSVLTGNVGIGTTSPSESLEISGSIKIVDGTQGDGKYLVSDSNGVASWQNLGDSASITAETNENITLTTSGTGMVLITGDSLKLSNTTLQSTATTAQIITLPDASGTVVVTSDGSLNNITSSQIEDNAITSAKIADTAIQYTDISDGAISLSKLGGSPGNGTSGTPLISTGDGSFTWGGFVSTKSDGDSYSYHTIDNYNVGIGTTNPTEALEVVGTVKVTDTILLAPQTSAPAEPYTGMMYFSSGDSKLKVYTGSAWQDLY